MRAAAEDGCGEGWGIGEGEGEWEGEGEGEGEGRGGGGKVAAVYPDVVSKDFWQPGVQGVREEEGVGGVGRGGAAGTGLVTLKIRVRNVAA